MRRHITNVLYPRLVESPITRERVDEQTWQSARLDLILELSTGGIPVLLDPAARSEPIRVRIMGIHGEPSSLDQIDRQRRWIEHLIEGIDFS